MIPPSHPQRLFLSPELLDCKTGDQRSYGGTSHYPLSSSFLGWKCAIEIFKKLSPSWSLDFLREARRCEGIGTQRDAQCLYPVFFFFPLCPLVVGPQPGRRYHFSAEGSLAGCSPSPLCRTLANLRTRPSVWLSSLHSEGRGRGRGGGDQEHQVLTYRISSAATNQDPG